MKTLDIKEAAQLLKMNPEALRRIAKRGDIPARKVGRKWIFVESALEDWLSGSYTVDSQTENPKRVEVHRKWQNKKIPSLKIEKVSGTSGSTLNVNKYEDLLDSL